MSDEEWGNLGDFDANDTRAVTKAAGRKTTSDPEWLLQNAEKNRLLAKDPKWRKNQKEGARRKCKTQEWLKKTTEKNRLLAKDPSWLKNNQDAHKPFRKEIVTPYGTFESILEAKKVCSNVNHKMKSLAHLYYLAENGPGEISYERVLYTPFGYCPYGKGFTTNANGTVYQLTHIHATAVALDEEDALKHSNQSVWIRKKLKNDRENYYIKEAPKREWQVEGKK